jgi:hypothetical protein
MSLDPRRPSATILRPTLLSADEPLSRKQKAFAAIEQRDEGFFTRNPWEPILDFDDSIVNQIRGSGGLVLVLALGDPFSISDTDRLAVLWDDEVVADGPKTVRQGDRVIITIPSVRGSRLSVWCTSLLTASVINSAPLSQASVINAQEAERARAAEAAKPTPGGFLGGLFETQAKETSKVAIVLGLAALGLGYLWLKGK